MRSSAKELLAQGDVNASRAELSAECLALAAEVLRESGRLRLQVRGESMLPTLWPHDVVEIASCCAEAASPGDIVLAERDGRFFLHRFVDRSQPGGFRLQGDSMPGPDPQFPDAALIGRLTGRFGHCASQAPADPIPKFRPWSRAAGRLFCYCGPARRLALKLHSWGMAMRNRGAWKPFSAPVS